MHLLIFDDETDASIRIFRSITRQENIFSCGPKNIQGSLVVGRLHRRKESATRILGGSKGLLSGLLGERRRGRAAQKKCQQNVRSNSMKALAFKLNRI